MQNIGSDLIRGNIDTIILKTMLDGDKYGLDIIKEVESRSNGTYELKQPTLYSCLKRLENQELISSYWLDSDIGGRRHYYKLTEKGRDFYTKKQEEWAKSKFIIDNLLSSFNYDEYRLVKKDDYDKIIENKQPDFVEINELETSDAQEISENTEIENFSDESLETEVIVLPNDNSLAEVSDEEIETEEELGVDLNVNLTDSPNEENDEFSTTNLDSDIEDFNSIDDNNDETFSTVENAQDTQKSERKYFVNIDDESEDKESQIASYKENNYATSENNILSILRQQDDEINTYVGDQHSYINHLNQKTNSDPVVVQDTLLNIEEKNDDILNNKINEFKNTIDALNNFDSSIDDEEYFDVDEIDAEEEPDSYNSLQGIELIEPNEDELIQETMYNQDENIYTNEEELEPINVNFDDEIVYNNTFELTKEKTKCACEYVDDFDDLNELNNQSNSSYLMNNDDVEYGIVEIKKQYQPENFYIADNTLTDSSDASFDFSESEDESNELFPTIDFTDTESEEDIITDEVEYQSNNFTFDDEIVETQESANYTTSNESISNYTIDDIISKNITSSAESITSNFSAPNEIFTPSYTSSNYKEKLSNLSIYSKNSVETEKQTESEATKKAKDIASLKEELELEGIKIKEYKKYGANEQAEKSYLLVNKINLINSLIMLFGYVFILSAVYIILNNTSFKETLGFHFKYFIIGFVPFIAIALYHGIKYIINPYKKLPAKYAPRIMIFISVIITIQLLLITYCVNLQLGFYSFTQAGYNHLIWLIPTILSFSPILYTTVYMILFYSKNFNI